MDRETAVKLIREVADYHHNPDIDAQLCMAADLIEKQEAEIERLKDAYRRGYRDGLAAYAWWKNGQQIVGTAGKTLAEAQQRAEETWNYSE